MAKKHKCLLCMTSFDWKYQLERHKKSNRHIRNELEKNKTLEPKKTDDEFPNCEIDDEGNPFFILDNFKFTLIKNKQPIFHKD